MTAPCFLCITEAEAKEDFPIGALPFTGLDYTIAMDQKLQSRTGSELLPLTEKVGGQTVTLRVYELDEDGYALRALWRRRYGDRHTVRRGSPHLDWEDEATEKVSLTVRDDVLGFPGFEVETVQGGRMTVRYFYALTEQGFVYAGEAFGHGFDDTEWGDGVWPLDLTGDRRSEAGHAQHLWHRRTARFCLPLERSGGNLAAQRHCLGESGCTACEAERAARIGRAGGRPITRRTIPSR